MALIDWEHVSDQATIWGSREAYQNECAARNRLRLSRISSTPTTIQSLS